MSLKTLCVGRVVRSTDYRKRKPEQVKIAVEPITTVLTTVGGECGVSAHFTL